MKVSFLTNKNLPPQKGTKHSRRGISFTVYKHKKRLLNVAGVKNQNHFEAVKKFVVKYLNSFNYTKVNHIRIDNIMFARKEYENYDMEKILSLCRKLYNSTHHIFYDDELLVSKGIFVKPRKKPNCSYILYRTGSVTVLGAKQLSDLHKCQTMIDKIFKACYNKRNNLRSHQ